MLQDNNLHTFFSVVKRALLQIISFHFPSREREKKTEAVMQIGKYSFPVAASHREMETATAQIFF